MAEYEAFACPCGRGDVILRESHKSYSRGKLYYACPKSKGGTDDHGCDFFLWKEERIAKMTGSLGASTPPTHSAGPSIPPTRYTVGPSTSSPGNTECPNCIKLNHQIMVLNKMLEVYMHPNNHTIESAALFHDLYNDMLGGMGNLRM